MHIKETSIGYNKTRESSVILEGTFENRQWYLVSGKVVPIVLLRKVPSLKFEGTIRHGFRDGQWSLVSGKVVPIVLLRKVPSVKFEDTTC